MSKTVSVGYTDTAISGVPGPVNFIRGLVNFGADWRKKIATDSELIMTNLTSPVDRPEKFRLSFSEVANIYAGTDIDQAVYAPSKRGVSVLCQLTETYSVTDSTDASFRIDLPISAHIVIKIPASEYLTADMVQTVAGRLVSGLYDTGSTTTARLNAIIRGSLSPSDLK
jgi:hypothetical protein